jgi:hypothetical protein
VKKLATLTSFDKNKTDKTNEFQALRAQKESLDKALASLNALKQQKSSPIEALVALESRILEIEQQLQGLGVNLGEFDAENSFCTVRVYLDQVMPATPTPIFVLFMSALEWAILYYMIFLISSVFGLVALYGAWRIAKKAKAIMVAYKTPVNAESV